MPFFCRGRSGVPRVLPGTGDFFERGLLICGAVKIRLPFTCHKVLISSIMNSKRFMARYIHKWMQNGAACLVTQGHSDRVHPYSLSRLTTLGGVPAARMSSSRRIASFHLPPLPHAAIAEL